MLSNCESTGTTSQYYVLYGAGAGAVFFSGSGSTTLPLPEQNKLVQI